MKVFAIYQAPLRSAGPDESLFEAADRMAYFEVGSLAIIEHGRLTGIITEHDLVRAIDDEVNLYVTPVSAYMSEGPIWVSPDEDVEIAIGRMLAIGARHLPVVEHGEVVGMISARDLLAVEGALVPER